MQKPYSILGKYYDDLSYDCDYYKWSQYLYNLIKKHFKNDITKIKGVDGACGTARITIYLKKAGLNIYGFDLSKDMLNSAIKNLANEGIDLQLVNANLINFKALKKLDFITISNDGVNYIENGKLTQCFKNIYNNLKKGGLLLFDISSEYKLKEILGNNTFTDYTDDITYIWKNSLDKDNSKINMDLTFFERKGSKYLRFNENHIQYIYKTAYLKEILENTGFSDIQIYDFFEYEKPKQDSHRIQFTAVKK